MNRSSNYIDEQCGSLCKKVESKDTTWCSSLIGHAIGALTDRRLKPRVKNVIMFRFYEVVQGQAQILKNLDLAVNNAIKIVMSEKDDIIRKSTPQKYLTLDYFHHLRSLTKISLFRFLRNKFAKQK